MVGQDGGSRPEAVLQKLEAALKAMGTTPKAFRNMVQWSGAFHRWAITAVCCGHWTWSQSMQYFDLILRISEQERVKSGCAMVAVLYDEHTRRTWSQRAARADPDWVLG